MQNKLFKYILFVVVTTLWATIAFILPDFADNPLSGWKAIGTLCVYLGILGIASFWVLLLGTIERHITIIFLPIFAVIGSAVAYFRVAYHATITPIILEVTFQTNPAEALSVMSWQLLVYIFLNLGISILLGRWRWRIGYIHKGWIFAIIAAIMLPIYYTFNSRIHQSINQRYPYNIPYNLIEYFQFQQLKNQPREMYGVHEIEKTDNNLNIIVIFGEAIRADHLSINGYSRQTTPKLSIRSNLINLGDVYSLHTHTSASLPHLLTPADTLHPELAYSQESWIPYLRNHGFKTAWISNQDITDSYAHFVYSADTLIFPNSEKSVYVFDTWTDEDLILPLMDCITDTGRHLCMLHTIGAHWYYNNHIPISKSFFSPTTTNRVITNNDSIAIINSYDNCILTMDWIVDSICSLLMETNSIVIYQSDHGESLGENGNWLHAAGAEETKHTAGFIWYSEQYKQQNAQTITYIDSLTHLNLSTDYLFPLIIRIAGLEVEK